MPRAMFFVHTLPRHPPRHARIISVHVSCRVERGRIGLISDPPAVRYGAEQIRCPRAARLGPLQLRHLAL
jgi:hypothetical protein